MADKKRGDLHDPREQKARNELVYEWKAKYSDNTTLSQYDDVLFHVYHFGHIAQDKVIEFSLISKLNPRTEISVNLLTGLFSINGKELKELKANNLPTIPLGLFLGDKKVVSSWGNKAKLIYTRNVRRDFNMGTGIMTVSIVYELGWEANVNGVHQKHTIILDSHGKIGIPQNTYEGFIEL